MTTIPCVAAAVYGLEVSSLFAQKEKLECLMITTCKKGEKTSRRN